MQLYFLRHGLADWPNWDRARDAERPLTDQGVEKMKAEARAIERFGLGLDAILSSPLVRARQTAEAVAERLNTDVLVEPALAPGFDVERLRDVLRRHPHAGALLLVGHEPDFSRTIAQLIGGGHVALKTGGLARVDLDSRDPPGGKLVWLLVPRTMVV